MNLNPRLVVNLSLRFVQCLFVIWFSYCLIPISDAFVQRTLWNFCFSWPELSNRLDVGRKSTNGRNLARISPRTVGYLLIKRPRLTICSADSSSLRRAWIDKPTLSNPTQLILVTLDLGQLILIPQVVLEISRVLFWSKLFPRFPLYSAPNTRLFL